MSEADKRTFLRLLQQHFFYAQLPVFAGRAARILLKYLQKIEIVLIAYCLCDLLHAHFRILEQLLGFFDPLSCEDVYKRQAAIVSI